MSDPPSPLSSAGTAASWPVASRGFLRAKSFSAGAPRDVALLSEAPNAQNPTWRASFTPSFAAQSLVEEGGAPGTLLSKALWALSAKHAFFVAATPYPHLVGTRHRVHQLLPVAVEYALEDYHSHHRHHHHHHSSSSSSGGGGGRCDGGEEGPAAGSNCSAAAASATAAHARRLCLGLAADMQPSGLRTLGWVLAHAFRWLFGGELYVDQAGLERLRRLHAEGYALVYVPTHKSHVDYLMLSYILFAAGLPCPHIAAGDNLALPLVGSWLRACGAFFIRRTMRGAHDSALYKRVLAGYVRALLEEGHSLEFFIEGGRSRDGRVCAPKLGLLSYVADAVLDGGLQKGVVCVPCSMSYDALVEERGLAKQLAGASKRKESLGGLLRTVLSLLRGALAPAKRLGLGAGGFQGRACVAFGEPIHVESFMQERATYLQLEGGAGPGGECLGGVGSCSTGGCQARCSTSLARCFPKGSEARRLAVAALGEEISAQLRVRSVLPTSVLVAAAFEVAAAPGSKAPQLPAVKTEAEPYCNGSAHSPAGSSTGGELRQSSTAEAAAAGRGSSSSSSTSPPESSGVGLEALQQAAGWLAGELQLRGAAVMQPHSAQGASSEDMLLHAVALLRGCLTVASKPAAATAAEPSGPDCSSASSSSGGGGAGGRCSTAVVVRREGGVESALRWHMRLNQLLPWVVGEGLLTCALLAEQVQHASSSSGSRRSVPAAAVLRRALWLRRLLAPEVDTALSPGALCTEASLDQVLEGMERRGAVACIPVGPGGAASLRLASAGSSREMALFAARALAPHIATYAAALRAAHGALSAQPAGLGSKALLQAVQAGLLRESALSTAAGPAPVPSLMLAQGAISSLTALGVLSAPRGSQQPAAAAAPDAAEAAAAADPATPGTAQALGDALQQAAAVAVAAGAEAPALEEGSESALEFSPQPSPIRPLCSGRPPRPEGSAAVLAAAQQDSPPPLQQGSPSARPLGGSRVRPLVKGGSSRGSLCSGSDSDNPAFDPVVASIATGLCSMEGGGGGGSSSSSVQGEVDSGEPGAGLPASRQRQLPTEQPTGTKSAADSAAAPVGPSSAAADTLLLSPDFAGGAKLEGLLEEIAACCVA